MTTLLSTDVNFTGVILDPEFVASIFQAIVAHGSQDSVIPLSDITIFMEKGSRHPYSLEKMLAVGNRIGDAIVYLQVFVEDNIDGDLSDPETGKRWDKMITHNMEEVDLVILGPDLVAKLVAVHAFYAMTRASPPCNPIPKFIKDTLGVDFTVEQMCDLFTSTNPANFNLGWIRHIKWSSIGQKALSRFGLGLAGSRALSPFLVFKPKPGSSTIVIRACAAAEQLARDAASWDFHPVTRNPIIISTLGNVNKNALNLMLEAFTEAEIRSLKGNAISKQSACVHEPGYDQWKSWTVDIVKGLPRTPIFGAD